jgi:hypothetical protein
MLLVDATGRHTITKGSASDSGESTTGQPIQSTIAHAALGYYHPHPPPLLVRHIAVDARLVANNHGGWASGRSKAAQAPAPKRRHK